MCVCVCVSTGTQMIKERNSERSAQAKEHHRQLDSLRKEHKKELDVSVAVLHSYSRQWGVTLNEIKY